MSFRIRRKVTIERFKRWARWFFDLRRPRYVGSFPKFKRFVTVMFLLTVDAYVLAININLIPEHAFDLSEKRVFAQEARWDGGSGREGAEDTSVMPDNQGIPVLESERIESMIRATFPEDQRTALAIAKAESGLDPEHPSTTDKMKDGRPFSMGLFQINLSVQKIDSLDCPKAFKGTDYGSIVVDEALYAACVAYAKDPVRNTAAARGIYERRGRSWTAWGAFTNGSFKRFL